MSKRSAGIVLYRRGPHGLEFLLVHPGGPYWRGKDAGAWSIPKGEYDEGEDPLAAALRELEEELGLSPPQIDPSPLTPLRQQGGKEVIAWGLAGEIEPETVRSNTFTIEWPPKSGRMQSFPEIDQAAWLGLEEARSRINAAQVPLLEELARKLER